jgi:glycosyltransferase involved in cell wall biosynthesis
MKIQCFLPVLNEADILPHTLRHLREQGASIHVIDGWSTDGTWEVAAAADSRERFPAAGPDPLNHHQQILTRIEHLAEDSNADWCLYSDADEWRRSPVAGDTLADGVARVDALGFSAIDFRVFQFYCTDDLWDDCGLDDSPERYFRYYDESDCISRIPNRKLWKNVGRVVLGGGGHEVVFPHMLISPQRFIMKHYPFRTPAQARAKVATRIARLDPAERAKGWGSHLDGYHEPFCWDPARLKFWKYTRAPLPGV